MKAGRRHTLTALKLQQAQGKQWSRSSSEVRGQAVVSSREILRCCQMEIRRWLPSAQTLDMKLECINHAHTRMGTALRKLSKLGERGGKGLGKETAPKCKALHSILQGGYY